MILKKENRSKYTPFHYWAEGYRHNTMAVCMKLYLN